MVRSSLDLYRRKRDFARTPEPRARLGKGPGGRFVVHEHHASRLHFDLRLEMGGVLKSFAVPKGPSLDPKDRRLAVETEDHPVEYLTFQGSIGDGQYGAGQMVIWDTGTYAVVSGGNPLDQYAEGKLHLEFAGERLRGGFMLIRSARGDRQWLLFKKRDDEAKEDGQAALLLPYGARTEKPKGFEIPEEALREVPALPGVTPKGRGKAAGKAASPAAALPGSPSGGKGRKAFKGPPGSRPASLPPFIPPMLATLADKPFDDPDWLFETKWDGWRALLRKDGEGIHLISRTGKSLDAMFPELLQAAESVNAGSCLLDGEITVLDGKGVPRFQLLQSRLKGKVSAAPGRIVYYAFDMPFREGFDLTACRLIDRKEALRGVLSGADSASLRFSEHFEGRGTEVFREATRLGFEGVVAKLKAGPYRRGRSADWLKIKSKMRQEVVIAGYTRPRGSRTQFGSLVTGLYDGKELVFTGHVGGGFNAALLKQVLGFMKPIEIAACPFAKVPKTNEKVQWVKPKLVAEAEFAEWTDDGRMRQPIFLGLRPDKDPQACVREVPQAAEALKEEAVAEASGSAEKAGRPGAGKRSRPRVPAEEPGARKQPRSRATAPVPDAASEAGPITHPGKVLWPADGYTKGDLAGYYRAVAPILLPHLKDRPLILKRYPNGIEAPLFYQHDVKSAPAFVKIQPVREKDGLVHYALCQNPESLLWLANLGVIAQNPWLSRVPHLDRPDWIVFDLDPQEVAFPEVCGMALYLKEILDGLGLKTWAKTSGSRGIHIYLPLKPAYDFSQALDFAQLVASLAVKRKPDAFTVDRSLKTRKRDRIYLDCMQNSVGKSVASVYSVRERPGATVSAALEWGELKKKIRMEDFTIRTMPKRLEKKGDLFAEVLRARNPLEGAFKKLEKLL